MDHLEKTPPKIWVFAAHLSSLFPLRLPQTLHVESAAIEETA